MRKNANQGDVKFYTLIAIVLGVITFFEFAFVEWQGLLFNQDGLILWSLYILSIVKFFLVVMFFMHLWGDHNLLTQLFTAGMVVGSITVALMLMLFTANNMNRYRVEQPVSVAGLHGGGHGDGHGDEAHVEIPVRDFAETLSRPAPKSQQHALAPRESIDAGSLNLPTISLPAINQGVQPAGSLELQPAIVEVTQTTTSVTTAQAAPQVVETVTVPVITEPVTTAPVITTTTETVTTEIATTEVAPSDDLATLRAQVEALRLELDAMESELPAAGTATATTTVQATTTAPTIVTTPVPPTTIKETVTTTVTQAAPVAATALVAAATSAVASNVTSNTTNTAPETISASAVITPTASTVDVSFDTELGNTTYMNCLACHQMTGEGIPGAFPPLKGHMPELYNADGGRDYLIQVVLYGLQGEINVGGTTYNGLMTPWGSLDDSAVAAVLNHELTSWGNDALLNNFIPITAEEVAAQRATPLTPQEVLANRAIQ